MRKIVTLRLTEEEHKRIKQNALKAQSKSVSDYIRRCAINPEMKVYDLEPIKTLNIEMRKIGTNINQIAHLCNELQSVTRSDINKISEEFMKIRKLIDKDYKSLSEFLVKEE